LLLSFLFDTKEFSNTILVVYHQKQQLHVIVKQTDGDELGSLRDAAWRSVTWTELTNSKRARRVYLACQAEGLAALRKRNAIKMESAQYLH